VRRLRGAAALALASGLLFCAPAGLVRAAGVGLDPSFGSGGRVTTDFPGQSDSARGMAPQPDGKLVVAGSTYNGPATQIDFALARYNADGTPDQTFGAGGKVTTDFNGSHDNAYAVAVQPADGKIVAAGSAYVGNFTEFALARYNPDGSPDASFGSGGRLTTRFNPSGWENANALAVQPDGKIVVTGLTRVRNDDIAVARYNPDGTLDASFGSGGKVVTDLPVQPGYSSFLNDDCGRAVAVRPDGRIVVGGNSSQTKLIPSTGRQTPRTFFALARYNADGTLDAGFGGDGTVVTNFPSGGVPEPDTFGTNNRIYALALQPDGRVVAAGEAYIDVDYDSRDAGAEFALARYNDDGTLDPGFGDGGRVTTRFDDQFRSRNVARSLAVQRDGKLVAAGHAFMLNRTATRPFASNDDFALARYNPDGSPDASFDDDGRVTTTFGNGHDDAYAVAVQPDGKIVLAGESNPDPNNNDAARQTFALVRYGANRPPSADAGEDLTVEAAGALTAVPLDGTASADPDGDALTYVWSEAGAPLGTGAALNVGLPLGPHQITLTVTDPGGETSQDSLTVNVEDTNAPALSCPADMEVAQDSAAGAAVTFEAAAADVADPRPSVTCSPASGAVFPLGTTAVKCTAADASSNSAACSFAVTVAPPQSEFAEKVNGGGSVASPGGAATFAVRALLSKAGEPQGTLTFQDHATGRTVRSTVITAVVGNATRARIFGKATIDGAGSFDFVADVVDNGEPGSADVFGIQLGDGYAAGGTLSGGNIQVHP
jgi:uncharacterized delta-60 repeat protein